ncbi:receptor-type tyrosine-protein phosphatase epsilon isoform X1 [Lepeophtheirus salmonis]|uniref:protein-tyrosine-phosphatase n=2 Tax=Lepeophtheirus salmonis TaxID=72036 RepID=A0A0K2UIG1_LEPSM|nr:receptor-type tyrosine-protein phosphatase epsilon-like isoform X1 [Lepeophtheirus salmonis]XP_040583037.1 receptor-type tyrosine-protein phosphatase epsilon-like isoform X1 [Lepeophtheirus salmonis]XP_040583038.1 receptor-type tyrosine-protein phosphatase epsilon-like isoform X1 [Lepeophtheirus salmonis]XP_040583039.1 receptor-type tyrosine-protein phosphatase epsilon-like isoform X1 [Lepeophtheirus salmonis]
MILGISSANFTNNTNTTQGPSQTTWPSTTFSPPPTTTIGPTNEKSSSTWIIILSTLIPISLILSALIGLYFYKKYFAIRLAKPISRQSSHMTDYDGYSVPIPIMDYSSELDRRLKSGTLTDEFQYINEYSSEVNALKTRTIGNDESNKNLNRFIDIIPFDDNVVLLESPLGSPCSKYINASLIKGLSFSTKDYIATQGPKRNTVIDFWNMIVEKNVCIIVCLTNVLEDNRIKCFQYWPEVGEMLNFDEITIHTLKERYNKSTQEVVVRDINVFHGTPDSDKKCHFVTQIHLTSWPDHGVPESTFPLLETCRIIRYSRKHLENEFIDPEYSSSPICVHCSAGVGRTGTLIAVHMICEQILDDALMEIDVLSTVKHLREQRQKMVQSVAQYKLVYQAIKDFINMKYHSSSGKDEEILSDYRVLKEETGYENEGYVE